MPVVDPYRRAAANEFRLGGYAQVYALEISIALAGDRTGSNPPPPEIPAFSPTNQRSAPTKSSSCASPSAR
jgi:hypothetical protein